MCPLHAAFLFKKGIAKKAVHFEPWTTFWKGVALTFCWPSTCGASATFLATCKMGSTQTDTQTEQKGEYRGQEYKVKPYREYL